MTSILHKHYKACQGISENFLKFFENFTQLVFEPKILVFVARAYETVLPLEEENEERSS